MVYSGDLKSPVARHAGSSPAPGTTKMKTVIVNGTFDILHLGHIALLNTARSYGDYLVVCIDTDRRVRELKGDKRPINDQLFRRTILSNFKSVDVVELFDSDEELIKLIKKYKPDIMVKGDDYQGKKILGETLIPKIIYYERTEHSTTKAIQDIVNRG